MTWRRPEALTDDVAGSVAPPILARRRRAIHHGVAEPATVRAVKKKITRRGPDLSAMDGWRMGQHLSRSLRTVTRTPMRHTED